MLSRNPIVDMDKKSPSICVFCGSAYGNNPKFREVARAIGAGIAAGGFSMVFGGGSNGLMGDVAAAAGAGGARVQGIIPAFLQALEGLEQVTAEEKLIVTPHMQERKTLMLQMSDAFIVLPGEPTRYTGQQGREGDFTELLATADRTGGVLGFFRQAIAPKSGPPTHLHEMKLNFVTL